MHLRAAAGLILAESVSCTAHPIGVDKLQLSISSTRTTLQSANCFQFFFACSARFLDNSNPRSVAIG